MKKPAIICYLLVVICYLTACAPKYEKFEATFPDYFDVDSSITVWATSNADFQKARDAARDVIVQCDKLYDIYHDYDGINNLKTINDNAGLSPVTVDPLLRDMITYAVAAYDYTDGLINVALGPVLSIWHDHRTAKQTLPDMAELHAAYTLCDINDVVIDGDTVFLKKRGMSLDVGAIAKGYAAQLAINAAVDAGAESVLLNMGGNVVTHGKPMNGRDSWLIGIQNPTGGQLLDTVPMNDGAVVSSGSYQRYFIVDGVSYGHIIDPATLMPPTRYTHVSVVCDSSAAAEMLSTAIFIADRAEGEHLAKRWNAALLWYYADGSIETTENWKGEVK
ncbi:thiamine biosynthesis lipoprotein ApbE [Clostridia bacterium]|nr:thiamine biosynthesis lipoprotein ApbE [Clostridia bacterium]